MATQQSETLTALATGIVTGTIRVVDLTVPLEPATAVIQLPPQFGASKGFSLEEISRYDQRGPGWYWNNISCGEHTGTHFDAPVHWVTGTSAPCTSIFKPVFLDAGLPAQGAIPGDKDDATSLWWRHEQLHRGLLGDFNAGLAGYLAERDALEASFCARVDAALARNATPAQRLALSEACWREADASGQRWLQTLAPGGRVDDISYRRSWARLNQVAGFPKGYSSSSSPASSSPALSTPKAS